MSTHAIADKFHGPNLVVAKLGAGGAVCLFTQSGADLVGDVNGWFPG